MTLKKRRVKMCKSHHNRFSRCMAFLMVIVLCISSMTLVSAQGDDSEGETSEAVSGGQAWVWEDDEKTVTVDVSDAAALPEGAEFVVEDLTEEEYEAAKNLIIDQSFRDNAEYGSTEEERVAYAQAVLSGLVLYDMHFVYEGTEYEVDSTQMTVTIENKTAVAAEEVVVVEDCGVYVIDDSAESSVVAIHIEETSDGENVAEVTDDAVTDDEGAVETVELTVETFSTIGYYTLTEYQMLPITDDTLIDEWGGSYTLYFILNNYNIFTSGNALAQHTVGAVAVGGTSSFTYGIGAGKYGTHPVPSYFQGGFVEKGFNSYIGGNAIYLTGYDSNMYSWAYQSYDVRFNDGGTGTIDSNCTHDKGYFIDFTAAMAAIEEEMNGYVNNSRNISVDISNMDATLEDDHYTVTYNGSSITVTVQSGYSYEFDDLDAIDYINIITGDDENDENVNIISKEDGTIVLPKVLLNGSNPTGSETDYGCGLVFMLPNAEEVDIGSKSDRTFLGHVIAPGAAVTSDVSGNTNGSFVCASFNVPSMENNMWSYNGSLIVPDSCFSRFTAAKTLDGVAPTDADDQFTFTLYEFDETSGEWDSLQTTTSAYGTGLVSFSDITYSSAADVGTHWYLISENIGDITKYTFDTVLYLVKVVITSETTGTGSTNTTYTAAATYYKAATGVTESSLIQSTTASGTTTYSVDMSKLTDITSELSSTDAETSEIFTFVNTTVKGSLWITKNVTVNGAATTSDDADGTYTFYVKNSSGTTVRTVEITITNGVSETVEVKDLPVGTYTVEEDVSLNPTGMSLTGGNDISVTVTENGTQATSTASFTNNMEKVGSLKITKNVTVNGEPTTGTAADGTYTFQIYYNEFAGGSELKDTVTITIENGQSNTVQVDNLAEGKYYILEVLSLNPIGMELVGGNSIVVEVKEENTGDAIPVASFTNNLTQTVTQTGSLKITKNVTVNGKPATESSAPTAADGMYTFYVVDENNNEVARTTVGIHNGESATVQVGNLMPGVYYVYEYLSGNPEDVTLVTPNGVEVTVTANNTADIPTVSFTNNKTEVGSLSITKNVAVNGNPATEYDDPTVADGDYIFYIIQESTGVTVADLTITIKNGISATEQVDNLEPGWYIVCEDVSGNPEGMSLTSGNDVRVYVYGDNTDDEGNTVINVAEFTNNKTEVGSLAITKSVTVNGNPATEYSDPTVADGTYTFYVVNESNEEVARQTITIVNGESKTETIGNLEPGVYYVYEYLDSNPTGVTLATANGVEVTVTANNETSIPAASFTNNKTEVGSLSITKNVTVNGKPATEYDDPTVVDGTYTFYVVNESNVEVARRNITIVNGESKTETIGNLEPGVYYVYEYLDSNPTGVTLATANGVEVTVTANNTADIPTASFTNNKTEVGSLSITKNVTVNGKPATEYSDPTVADGTYTFYVVNESNVEVARRNITIVNGESKTETIGNLEPGVYYVYEYLSSNPTGVTLATANGVEVTVTANNEADIPTATFTNNKTEVGSLSITKNVTVNGKPATEYSDPTVADGTYTFYVVNESNVEVARRNITIVNGESKTETIGNLEPGVYYVYEYLSSNPTDVTLATANGVEVTVTANNETSIPAASFTNNKTEVGSLSITKNVTVNGKPATEYSDPTVADGTYTFYVVNESNVEVARRNITIVNGESKTETIGNLEPGVYYVYEYLDSNPAGMSLATANGVEVTVTANNTADIPTASFTNNKTEVGSLSITKNVTVNGKPATEYSDPTVADGTYTFYVVNESNVEVARQNITIVNGESKTETIGNLEPGVYYVYEYLDSNPAGVTLATANGVEVTVTANNTVDNTANNTDYEANIPTATFTNNKTEVGSLSITKNVTVNGKTATEYSDPTVADGTYTFYVVNESNVEVARRNITIVNGESKTETIGNLEPGVYYVYEYLDSNPDGMTLATANGVEVTVTANNEANIPTATFTNNKTEVGSLSITKNVTVNGKPATEYDDSTVADGTYTFYVVNESNEEVARRNITIVNGESKTETIGNLEPGVYYVYEYLDSNPTGMTLATANGVEVIVTANNTDNAANIPTATFTNNKTEVGSLKITINVTINGKDSADAEDPTAGDGTYTFYVLDESGNEVARCNITIVNGESKTEQIDNLIPGVYYVYEYLDSNLSDVTLVTENGIQVTVTADETAEIPTAAFTNNVDETETSTPEETETTEPEETETTEPEETETSEAEESETSNPETSAAPTTSTATDAVTTTTSNGSSTTPQTGDSTQTAVFLLLLLASAVAAVMLKRQDSQKKEHAE